MTRGIVLLPLLAVALVYFTDSVIGGQDITQKRVEIVKYPVLGSEDAVGEVETKQARAVLDDFYKVLNDEAHTVATGDLAADTALMADQAVTVSERFGIGERLTKSQWATETGSGHMHLNKRIHDHVRLVAFGANTVVLSGRSFSTLQYEGKGFNGPRVFVDVWVKQGGRWQWVLHSVADAPNGARKGFE